MVPNAYIRFHSYVTEYSVCNEGKKYIEFKRCIKYDWLGDIGYELTSGIKFELFPNFISIEKGEIKLSLIMHFHLQTSIYKQPS